MEGHNGTDIPEASRDVCQQAGRKGQEAQGPSGGRDLAPRRVWGLGSVAGEGRAGGRALPPVPPPPVFWSASVSPQGPHTRGGSALPCEDIPFVHTARVRPGRC